MKIDFLISKILKKVLHPKAVKNSKIEKKAQISSGTYFLNSKINKYSYVGNFCTVVNTEIGKFTSIGDECCIGSANHPIDWVSSSPVFHKGRNILKMNFSDCEFSPFEEVLIGNDVWIGTRVLIKSGVKIGDGAVIGMGSIVTHDVEPYTIVAGVPAKLIRERFPVEITNELKKIEWWNFSEKKLKKFAKYIDNPLEFISKIMEEK